MNNKLIKSLFPKSKEEVAYLEYLRSPLSFREYLELDISYDIKIHIIKKKLTTNQLIKWAVLCSESVLHILEKECPKDKSVRKLLDFMKTIDDYDNMSEKDKGKLSELRAYASAYAAYNAAGAGGAAAGAAAGAYDDAVYAAVYAVYAADAAAYTAANREKQEEKNIKFALSVIG